MNDIWTRPPQKDNLEPLVIENIYKAEFETAKLKTPINSINTNNLYLIATKKNNMYYSENPNGQIPFDEGYLYLDEVTQKLYYSKGTYDNAEYLCDWNKSIANNLNCQDYHCTITKDGDLIFMRRPYQNNTRSNPIIYPNGDYNNPKMIDFGDRIKPFSFVIDNAIEHSYNKDFFIFGEYRGWNKAEDNSELYIWKVTKPYDNPDNWRRVDTWHIRHYESGDGPNPNREIGHFHTANFDFYSGAWIVSTGDVGHQCRFLVSKDDGETWVDQNTGGGQRSRTVGMIFTKDAMYYQTDSTRADHALYKVNRGVDGYLDFSNLIKICNLSQTGEAGYCTALMRDPYGLLFIDRMESRIDLSNTISLYFYSLDDEKLYKLGTYNAIEEYTNFDSEGRYGLPPTAFTHYQPPNDDGIIMGSTSKTKPFLIDILNNNAEKLIGNIKMKIVRVR